MKHSLSSEDRLILLLARGQVSPLLQEYARAVLSKTLDWDRLLAAVIAEDVYPLFYRNLTDLGSQYAPTPHLKKLHDLAKVNALRMTMLGEELGRTLRLLNKAGIAAIPLKGVALAQSLYGDPALRASIDIDILVPRTMVAQSLRLLRSEGYRSEFSTEIFAGLLLRHDIEYALTREDHGVRYLLELHWGVWWGGRREEKIAEDLWAEACATTAFGAQTFALSPEWQVLFLAAHAARHKWQGLKWLVDIHELCATVEIDWGKLNAKARRLDLDGTLRITVGACHALFDTPVPAECSVGALPSWLELYPAAPSASWRDAFFPTRLLSRPSEKLRYAARVFLVPTLAERRLVHVPSAFGFMYYPLRPLRLAYKWSRALGAKQGARSMEQRAGSRERKGRAGLAATRAR